MTSDIQIELQNVEWDYFGEIIEQEYFNRLLEE